MSDSFAVLIVTHNSADTLPACLASLKSLSPQPEEILIIDNASTDSSPDIVRRWGFQLEVLPENTGFTGGMNHGLSLLKSPWVLSLNPDCALGPDFIRQLFEGIHARKNPESIGAATGLLLRATGPELLPSDTVDAAGMVVTSAGRHFDRGAGGKVENSVLHPAWVFGGTGAATLYRRQALDDVAFEDGAIFAPAFFAYREDAELAWRLQWRGWRCLFEAKARGAHLRGLQPEGGRSSSRKINRFSVRNRFLMRIHCADISWHLRCFPHWFFRDLLVLGACLSIELSSFPALIDVIRKSPDALRRRRWVLRRRTCSTRHMARWFRKRHGCIEEISLP